ncbi:MAG: S41 family peptidase [Chloroflexota bacterium]
MKTKKLDFAIVLKFIILFFCLGCGALTTPASTSNSESGRQVNPSVTVATANNEQSAQSSTPTPELIESDNALPVNTAVPPPDLPNLGPLVTPTFFPAVYTDTSRQLETFDAFWEVVQEDYIYPDFNGLDWNNIRATYRPQVEQGLSNPEFWNLLEQIIYQLDDEHSYFVPTDESEGIRELFRSGVGYSGVGVSLIGRPAFGDALVGWAIPGNGAYEAGIRDGDRILTVNGFPICCQPNGEPFQFLLGPEGSTAVVTYQSADENIQTVEVQRAAIQINNTIETEILDDHIGYMQINTFLDRDVRRKFDAAWEELNSPVQLNGFILDLRTNTGGLVNPSNLIMYNFVDGPIYYFYEFGEAPDDLVRSNISGTDRFGSQTVPMVVLVGPATNSRGEVLAGIFQTTGRATLIGQPTNGNIETVTPFDLPDGSILYLATDTIIPLSLENWEEDGLTVDIFIEQTYGEIALDGIDQALTQALEILKNQ